MLTFIAFILTIIATIEVGIKKIRFVACAMCCSIPKINVSKNISIVPPPIPVPLTIPEISPVNISGIFLPPLGSFRLELFLFTLFFKLVD